MWRLSLPTQPPERSTGSCAKPIYLCISPFTSSNVDAMRRRMDRRFDVPHGLRVATDSHGEAAGHDEQLAVQAGW